MGAGITDAIIDAQAFLSFRDYACFAQARELLRHICLPLANKRGQVANAFFAVAEGVEQPQSRGMRHGAQ